MKKSLRVARHKLQTYPIGCLHAASILHGSTRQKLSAETLTACTHLCGSLMRTELGSRAGVGMGNMIQGSLCLFLFVFRANSAKNETKMRGCGQRERCTLCLRRLAHVVVFSFACLPGEIPVKERRMYEYAMNKVQGDGPTPAISKLHASVRRAHLGIFDACIVP